MTESNTSRGIPRPFKQLMFFVAALVFGLGIASASPLSAQVEPVNGRIDWEGWSFDVGETGNRAGLGLKNVSYNGLLILDDASHPVMNVFYERDYTDDGCGPFADLIGDSGNEDIFIGREFTQNGEKWLEAGLEDYVGQYVIRQVWYLSENGVIDAHMFSKGVQCTLFHEHYPYWRFDFNIGGDNSDQILRARNNGYVVESTEFDRPATDANNHGWRVEDASGASVDFTFDDGSFSPPVGPNVAETEYSNNWVFGRRYVAEEDRQYRDVPVRGELANNDGQSIDGEDLVVWYSGYMPHGVDEAEDVWHSTGVRLTVNGAPTEPPPPSGGSGAFVDHPVPGAIEAEDYDLGGQGTAYNELDVNLVDRGNEYRPDDDVDIYKTLNEPDGSYTVGRTVAGEWLNYTINVDQPDTYQFDLHMATGSADAGRIEVFVDETSIGSARPESTNSWWNFQPVKAGEANLTAGEHVIRLTWRDGAKINLDNFTISQAGDPGEPPPPGGDGIASVSLSPSGSITFAGIAAQDEDILTYNTATDEWEMTFDGSDVGLGTAGIDVSAFHIEANQAAIWIALNTTTRVPGIDQDITPNDIIRFTPTSLGATTAGSWEVIFDGSDSGLDIRGESITGLTRDANGDLYISTQASGRVGSIDIRDVDVLRFTPTRLGPATEGTWSLHLQGADLDLAYNGTEDIWGLSSLDSSGGLYFTTRGDYTIPGFSGTRTDILSCQPTSVGQESSCNFAFEWDPTLYGFPNTPIDGLHISG